MSASNRITISLAALAANYQLLCSRSSTDVAAVVKADGYGLGSAAVASRLRQEGCREFFVATAAEGQRLRQVLSDAAIYVLEGALPDSLVILTQSQLVPILNTPAQVALWAGLKQPAGLHLDTGMQRLGMSAAEVARAFQQVAPVTLLMSHLACADEPDHPFNRQQTEQFLQQAQALLQKADDPRAVRLSLCNSAGILSGLAPQQLGRAGIALYGGNPFSHAPNPMQPVVGLSAQILQVRVVPAGTPVGYGGTFVSQRQLRVATLAAGYADGVPRLLSGVGRVWAQEQFFPIIGRVSMDMLHVDITAADRLHEGSWMEVIGPHVGVDEVAQHAQTISYEVLTGLRARGDCLLSEHQL